MAFLLVLTFCFPALAAAAWDNVSVSGLNITNDGNEITVSWQKVTKKGLDQYEVQIAKTDSKGEKPSNTKKQTVGSDETSCTFTVNSKGYYSARIRAKNVSGEYTEWTSYLKNPVVVTSDDVSNSKPHTSGSGNSGSPNGPGVSGSNNSAGGPSSVPASSSSGETSRHVKNIYVYSTYGWILTNGRWWFLYADGTYPVNSWRQINGKFYYFDNDGYMLSNTWLNENGNWRFLTASGAMAVDWTNVSERWYYMGTNDGVMFTEGQHVINKRTYYMDASGASVRNNWAGGHFYGPDGVMTQ